MSHMRSAPHARLCSSACWRCCSSKRCDPQRGLTRRQVFCADSPIVASRPRSADCTIVRRMLGRSLSSQGKPLSRVQHSSSGSAARLGSRRCNICSLGVWLSRRTSCVVAKLASPRSQNVSATVRPVRSASPSLAMLATHLRNTLARMRPRTPFIPGWRRGLLAPLKRALPHAATAVAAAARESCDKE